MPFRIEMSAAPEPAARVYLPGRQLELSAYQLGESEWQVRVADPEAVTTGIVGVSAANANEAIWRVARAAVRAVAELRGETVEFPEPTI